MSLDKIKEKLSTSQTIVFFTGAGISTESGVPDFRSPGGIWSKYKPVYFNDFLSDPVARLRYWTMKKETHDLYKNIQPNSGHHFITQIHQAKRLLGVITQNIDGLHSLSGLPYEKLVELHGTDRKIACVRCHKEFEANPIFDQVDKNFAPPHCDEPGCPGLLKPATISFGQSMPVDQMRQSIEWSKSCDLFIVVGSSLQVHPAADLPVIAKTNGAHLIIVNRDPTPLDSYADDLWNGEIKDWVALMDDPMIN